MRGRGLDAAAITALGSEPALADVETLDLPCLAAPEWRALLAPGVFPGLTRLEMIDCRLGDRAVAALGGLAARDAITKLDLARGKTSPAVLKALLGLERRAPLTVVVSGLRSVPTAGLAEVGARRAQRRRDVLRRRALPRPRAPRPHELSPSYLAHRDQLRRRPSEALAGSTNTAALRRIAIDACDGATTRPDYTLTRDAALALVEAPGLTGVVELAFNTHEPCQQPGIGRAGLADVLSAPFAPTAPIARARSSSHWGERASRSSFRPRVCPR